MHAVEGRSRDGLTLVSYLTLPADIEGDRPAAPLPMVVIVHGGPWARDIYRGDHQWLADRGYAVLSVNYRGSTGFGKAFVAASEKQHARKMHDDLIDMVDWAVGEGIAQKDKIAIFGVSYGGVASLLSASFPPAGFFFAGPGGAVSQRQSHRVGQPPPVAALVCEKHPLHRAPRA